MADTVFSRNSCDLGCECPRCISFFNGSSGWLRIKNAKLRDAFQSEFPSDAVDVVDWSDWHPYSRMLYVVVSVVRAFAGSPDYYVSIRVPDDTLKTPAQIDAVVQRIRAYFERHAISCAVLPYD